MMNTLALTLGTFAGFLIGLFLGMMAVMHITRGMNIREIIVDKTKKIWLGLFAWFFAVVGAYLGWHAAAHFLGLPG